MEVLLKAYGPVRDSRSWLARTRRRLRIPIVCRLRQTCEFFMTTTEAIYARRAVRDFTAEPLKESTINKLIDAAIQAPSAINAQPWAFVVVQDKAILDQISSRTKDLMQDQPMSSELREKVSKPGWSIFYNATTLIVICARPEGAHPEWDCCLAAENLLLAARDKGIGGCIVGFAWAALALPDVKKLLNIPDSYQAVMPIILGYPRSSPPPTGRKSPEILSWKIAAHV